MSGKARGLRGTNNDLVMLTKTQNQNSIMISHGARGSPEEAARELLRSILGAEM